MKKVKFLVLSNILLSVLYAVYSIVPVVFGLMLAVCIEKIDSIVDIILLITCVLLIVTPIFGVIGIVLSVKFRKKEKYFEAFAIQLLPFSTVVISAIMMVISMIMGVGLGIS